MRIFFNTYEKIKKHNEKDSSLVVVSPIACKEDVNPDANVHHGRCKGIGAKENYTYKNSNSTLVMPIVLEISENSKFESHITLEVQNVVFVLDRGQTNSIDNNLPFFAEPGEIKIETIKNIFC